MKRTLASSFLAILAILAIAACIAASSGQSLAADESGSGGYIAPKTEVLGVFNNKVNSPMVNYGAEAGVNLSNNVSLGVDVLGTYMSQRTHNPVGLNNNALTNSAVMGGPVSVASNPWQSTNGLGGDGLINWSFYKTDNFGLYTGLNLGFTAFDHVTPANSGASFLFKEGAKLGFTARLTESLDLDTAAKFDHLGEFSDKGLNGLGGSFDLKYHF